MRNTQYLKENGLYRDYEHFKRLSEAFLMSPTIPEEEIEEAGEEEQPADPAMGGMPDGGTGQGMDAAGGAMPDAGGAPGMDMGMAPEGQDPNMQPAPDAMGGMPDGGMGGEVPGLGAEDVPDLSGDVEDEGDFIDIEGLTTAQDKLNVKQNRIGRDVSKVDNRIDNLIDTVQALLDKVDSNNSEIESLKAEFEKRNPTQTEKLNMRSLDSYPFNVKTSDFWDEKAKSSNYQPYADNAEPTSKEYVITNDDVDNVTDDIMKTFFKPEDEDIQTLSKIFNLP